MLFRVFYTQILHNTLYKLQGFDAKLYQLFLNEVETASLRTHQDIEESFRTVTVVLLCHIRLSFQDICTSVNSNSPPRAFQNDETLFRQQLLTAGQGTRLPLQHTELVALFHCGSTRGVTPTSERCGVFELLRLTPWALNMVASVFYCIEH